MQKKLPGVRADSINWSRRCPGDFKIVAINSLMGEMKGMQIACAQSLGTSSPDMLDLHVIDVHVIEYKQSPANFLEWFLEADEQRELEA